jgi:predicted ABC-type ATPase
MAMTNHERVGRLEVGGESAAAELVAKLGSKAEVARELAYRLYTICERKKRAGKTTTASCWLQGALAVSELVNADAIASGLSAFRPESVALAAGRLMLARIKQLAVARADFAFETTLAGRNYAPWLRTLQATGYRVHLMFLSLPSPELAVARVAERVRLGGHDVPEDVIRRRFAAGLRNFFGLYQDAADAWQLYDNAALSRPRLIASRDAGGATHILDREAWGNLARRQR